MTEQLGKIEKPEAASVKGKRKLYVVTLIYSGEGAPIEYIGLFNKYWEQVGEHVANLESKISKVAHVYHESIVLSGENGLKVMEKLDPPGYRVTQEKCKCGAAMEATEDKDLAEENMDWERCLIMGFFSRKVASQVSQLYVESARRRYEYIAKRIDETLKPDEVGLLFIREGHLCQFASDIEVFSVAPPALDEIRRWQRDRATAEEKAEAEPQKEAEKGPEPAA